MKDPSIVEEVVGSVAVGCQLAIGVVFAVAAVSKVRDFGGFADGLRRMGLLPPKLVRPVAATVVAGEIATVLLLAIPGTLAIGFACAAVLLAGFTVTIVLALRRASAAACRCFGASERPLSQVHVVRNALLLVIVACGLAGSGQVGSVVLAGAAVAGAAGLATATALIALDDIVDLFAPAARH
jgi:hypothetical protein